MIEPGISLDLILRASGREERFKPGAQTRLNNLRQRQRNHITSIMYQTLIHQLTEQSPCPPKKKTQTAASYQAACPLSGPRGQKKPKTHSADGERKKNGAIFRESVLKLSDPQCLSVQSAPRGGREAPRGEREREGERGRRKRDDGDGGKKRGTREKVMQKERKDLQSWFIIARAESEKQKLKAAATIISHPPVDPRRPRLQRSGKRLNSSNVSFSLAGGICVFFGLIRILCCVLIGAINCSHTLCASTLIPCATSHGINDTDLLDVPFLYT